MGKVLGAALAAALLWSCAVRAEGEPVDGFPNWKERVLLEWVNRARVDPHAEMAACAAAGHQCGEAACYAPVAPLRMSAALAHSARFHADNMAKLGYFQHDSACPLVDALSGAYPAACDGGTCACSGGVAGCGALGCTSWSARVGLFGGSASGEIIAGSGNPNTAFYSWLYEDSADATCRFTLDNGHRWNILKLSGATGAGQNGSKAVMDFGAPAPAGEAKIPSGAHYPQAAATVELWANWHDTAPPRSAQVNVDGVCAALTLARGTAANGAWTRSHAGTAGTCRRYYFTFTDSAGRTVDYPTTGSFGIGAPATCPGWSAARPADCSGQEHVFQSNFGG